MKPDPTAAQARLDSAINARNEARAAVAAARAAEADATKALQAAHITHCVHVAAECILADPDHIARLRFLVARGRRPEDATPLDCAMYVRHAGLVAYRHADQGRKATAAAGDLAAAVLALIDAPETP